MKQLCGYELDIDFPKETENLMCQLSSLENTDVSTQRLLSSVIELRKNRWGRTEPNGEFKRTLLFHIFSPLQILNFLHFISLSIIYSTPTTSR